MDFIFFRFFLSTTPLQVLQQQIDDLNAMIYSEDVFGLMFRLRGSLSRNQHGMLHEGLFSRANAGTKASDTHINPVFRAGDRGGVGGRGGDGGVGLGCAGYKGGAVLVSRGAAIHAYRCREAKRRVFAARGGAEGEWSGGAVSQGL